MNKKQEIAKLIEFAEFAKENQLSHLMDNWKWQEQLNALAEQLPPQHRYIHVVSHMGLKIYEIYQEDFINWSYAEVVDVKSLLPTIQ
jgi:hypothetical protein